MSEQQPAPEKTTSSAGVTRRKFVGAAAGAGAAFMIVPRHVLGRGFQAPSDKLNIAVVGLNGQGGANAQNVMSENVVALCDCDFGLLDNRIERWERSANPPASTGQGRRGGGGRLGGRRGGQRASGTV